MATKQRQATWAVTKAIQNGDLVRPESCELCPHRHHIVAHHYKGYDFPLAIWWVCNSCNITLGSRTDLTKEQAKAFILARRSKKKKPRRRITNYPEMTLDEWLIANRPGDITFGLFND